MLGTTLARRGWLLYTAYAGLLWPTLAVISSYMCTGVPAHDRARIGSRSGHIVFRCLRATDLLYTWEETER